MNRECVITFFSTHQALQFERATKKNGFSARLIPVPRRISSSCGLAGSFKKNDLEAILNICREQKIEFAEIYQVDPEKEGDFQKLK